MKLRICYVIFFGTSKKFVKTNLKKQNKLVYHVNCYCYIFYCLFPIGGGGIGNKNITEHAMDYSCQVTFDYNYYPSKKRKDMDRISDQIKIKLSSALSTLSATAEVSVLVLPFSNSVIRSISSAIISLVDCKNHSEFKEEMKELIAKHPKHKNELTNICDDINELKSGKGIPPSYFVLYSMEDQTFKILML